MHRKILCTYSFQWWQLTGVDIHDPAGCFIDDTAVWLLRSVQALVHCVQEPTNKINTIPCKHFFQNGATINQSINQWTSIFKYPSYPSVEILTLYSELKFLLAAENDSLEHFMRTDMSLEFSTIPHFAN
jgi:hypothetical protein